MSIIKKFKETYDSIEIPKELDYVVKRAINKGTRKKQKDILFYIKKTTATLATSFSLFIILLNTNQSFAQTMKDIPVVNQLAKVFTIREYKQESENNLIDVKIPAIQNTGNTDLENKINYEISSKMNDIIKEAEKRAEEYKEAVLATGGTMEDYIPTQINIDYEITYQDDKLISFIITKTESFASAYTEQYFYNIDMENGKELNLRDILGENYKEIVDKEVKEQIEKRKEDENNIYFEAENGGFSGIENEYQDFYIASNGKATIVFQKYEIAPGYMGIQNFEIPNNILQKQ